MPNSLRLGLGLGRGRSGVGISVSIGAGPFTTGTLLTATVNGLEGGETVTYQWQDDGVNITGATSSTYTAAIGTDSVADASDIRCQITVDGGDPINSSAREIRYAAGSVTESALADWTIDDDVLNVNLASDFTTTNLTGSYVITGLPTGAVDDGDGTISGTVDGTTEIPTLESITATFTDQYGRTIIGTYSVDTVYRTQATAANGLGPYIFVKDQAISAIDATADFTANGNTLTYADLGLPSGLSFNVSNEIVGTPDTILGDDDYIIRATDEYGRATDSTISIQVVETGTITLSTATYTRGSAGVSPSLAVTGISTSNTTGPYYLDVLTVTNGTTPSQTDMDNGSGTGVLEKLTLGPQADIANLDGDLDLSVSVTNGRIYIQYRDSAGNLSALTSVATADSITYDAVAPTFSSAEVGNVDATSLIVTFGKAIYGSSTAADWDVQVAGAGATESAVSFTPGGTTLDITLGAAVTSGQAVTAAYSGTGLIGIDAEQMATFTAQSVTNNVSGFTETSVTVPSGAVLTASSTMTNAPGMLAFYSIENAPDARDAMFSWDAVAGVLKHNHTASGALNPLPTVATTPTANSAGDEAAIDITINDRMHVLVRARITGGNLIVDQYAWNATDAAWESAGSDTVATSDSNINLAAANMRLFARSDDAANLNYAGDIYRAAFWGFSDVSDVPDITSSTVQDWFTSGSALVDPSTSQTNVASGASGTVTRYVDMYGAASRYNAGTNDGTLTLTASGGTFT